MLTCSLGGKLLRVEEKAKLEECGAASHHIRKEEIDGLVAVTQFVFENFSKFTNEGCHNEWRAAEAVGDENGDKV